MSDESLTKPTIETILGCLQDFRASIERRLDVIEQQLENMDIRFDRLEGFLDKTHSEVMYLRADFKEFKFRFKEPAELNP